MTGELWNCWIKSRYPGIIAVELESGSTFKSDDICELVDIQTRELAELPPGSVIGLCEPNSIRWLARFLAIQKAGCCALLLDSGLSEVAAKQEAQELRCSHLWLEKLASILPDAPLLPETALIKLTSGSSGVPQRVMCSAAQMIADGRHCASTMGIRPEDRQLGTLPLGHSYALGNLILPLILQGSPLYFCSEFTTTQVEVWIRDHQITVYPTIPVIIKLLAESPSITDLSSLRTLISAGAPLSPSLAQNFHRKFRIFVHNFYGSSETGGICYDRSGEAGISGRSLGTPLDGVDVTILENGQIQVQSAAVASQDGTYSLEDLGEMTADGEVRLIGRREEWVNIGGKKIRSGEISSRLSKLSSVSEVWTGKITRGDREWLKTIIVGNESAQEYRRQLTARLPSWKVPREIKVTDSLPRTSRGKLDRTKMLEM